jgi:hypothetical protein
LLLCFQCFFLLQRCNENWTYGLMHII